MKYCNTLIAVKWFKEYQKSRISVCDTDCSNCYCYGNMCNACEGKYFILPKAAQFINAPSMIKIW